MSPFDKSEKVETVPDEKIEPKKEPEIVQADLEKLEQQRQRQQQRRDAESLRMMRDDLIRAQNVVMRPHEQRYCDCGCSRGRVNIVSDALIPRPKSLG